MTYEKRFSLLWEANIIALCHIFIIIERAIFKFIIFIISLLVTEKLRYFYNVQINIISFENKRKK